MLQDGESRPIMGALHRQNKAEDCLVGLNRKLKPQRARSYAYRRCAGSARDFLQGLSDAITRSLATIRAEPGHANQTTWRGLLYWLVLALAARNLWQSPRCRSLFLMLSGGRTFSPGRAITIACAAVLLAAAARAQRVGRLQRMPPVDALLTSAAAPDMHIKAPNDGVHERQIFLILRGDVRLVHGATTPATGRREGHVMHLLHDRRRAPVAMAPVARTGLPTRPTRSPLRGALGERRRLTRARAARGLQLLLHTGQLRFKAGALTVDPATLSFRLLQLAPQFRILSAQLVDRVIRSLTIGASTHAPVMPESQRQYKSKPGNQIPILMVWDRFAQRVNRCIGPSSRQPTGTPEARWSAF